eukprot:CAMPEP_0204524324 /NCGR_PEP_ID=MMETSP0661-20131031/7317_1 /ASSEMBLY_ACC=CAM_ASM_000606 /TAXON_ID=109239 /ORGANISM="Alexandrium margalefi, Strain AMGDE01CS-322" /LENGTH=263 /DNA_ID=CAMNT_0051530075 /DNA_START=63 /DNA_END=851 /DNA_ORIENTATION=+
MGRYVGAVKSFNAQKGWGFLECAETFAIYGKDILFQKSELPGPVEKGSQLSFSVAQGRNGMLAVELMLLDQAPAKQEHYEEDGGGVGPGTGNYVGTLKSYNPLKGWGFIECAETQQLYGKDILVLKTELRGVPPTQGTRLGFSVAQGRKGPIATSLRMLPKAIGAISATPGPADMQARLGGGGAKRKLLELEYSQTPQSPSYLGTIKSFNLAKGWGFVECADTEAIYGKDILVLKDELAGGSLERGQRVSFSVKQGRNGPLAT